MGGEIGRLSEKKSKEKIFGEAACLLQKIYTESFFCLFICLFFLSQQFLEISRNNTSHLSTQHNVI